MHRGGSRCAVYRERSVSEALAVRAAAAGYRAIVLTVDVPVLWQPPPRRAQRLRAPSPLVMAHMPTDTPRAAGEGVDSTGSAIAAAPAAEGDAGLTFDDIGWLAAVSGLPVVVKGVLRGDDAAPASTMAPRRLGLNHGGRQLDGAVATADAGGGRRRRRWAGRGLRRRRRPHRHGRAARPGAQRPRRHARAAGALRPRRRRERPASKRCWGRTAELARAMALCGARTVAELSPDLLAPHREGCPAQSTGDLPRRGIHGRITRMTDMFDGPRRRP